MRKRLQKGSLSMFMLLGMSVLLVLCLGASSASMHTMLRARRDTQAVAALQAAQAGLDYEIALAFEDLQSNNGYFTTRTRALGSTLSSFLTGLGPGASVISTVIPTADPKKAWATCTTATFEGMTKSVRTFLDSRNVGIWNNAIFAGSGASGQAINGNVDIRGSVHILGEGEAYSDINGNGQRDPAEPFTDQNANGTWDPGEPFVDSNGDNVWNAAEPYNDTNHNGLYDPPLTQTDLNSSFSGNAHIGNNYTGMPAGLEAMVPAAPRISGIEQLGTEVRVKHGRISIQGSATVGDDVDPDGGTSKGQIDGSFVSDGYTGSAGAGSVFSDNGTSNTYDLGSLGIRFPLIGGVGAEPFVAPSGTYATYETFYESRALVCPVATIKADTPAFSYGPDAFGNSITFVPAAGPTPAILTVNGVIRFNADLQIGAKNSHVRFAGRGTIYSRTNIKFDGNFLPAPGTTFPTTSAVGVVAKRDILLATGAGSSQLEMAGAFYAQGIIKSAKQNQIAGTFVASYYDMGTNVPNIYQVPELVNNMPPAMPGDKLYFTLKQKSWRER